MKAPDLAVRGGTVLLGTGPVDADVVIRGERIAALTVPGFGPVARDTIDARGLYVLPGLIDLHVHLREPGLTHKEDFATGTRAALAGGFTTVFDMPNVQPATTTTGAFCSKVALAASKAHCDFGLWAGGADPGAYRAFADLGAVGIKIYQQQLARIQGNAYFKELFCTEEDALHEVFRGAAKAGLPVCLHAGAPGIEAAERERLIRAGRTRMQDLNALRFAVGTDLPEGTYAAAKLEPSPLAEQPPVGQSSLILLKRPDVQSAERQLMAANADIAVARAEFFPVVSLTGQVGYSSRELSDLFDGSGGWSFGPSISLPIFDAGARQANLDATLAQREIALASYEQAIQAAFRDTADALAVRRTIDERVDALVRLVEDTEVTRDLSDERFRVGVDDYLSVLDSQQLYYDARQQLIQANLVRNLNVISVYRALGAWPERLPAADTPPES